MSTSEYDSLRPPEPAGGKHRKGTRSGSRGGGDGSREISMVPEADFSSYYGRPVVKPAPWGHEVAAYLFLGGVAGGSGLLAAGAQLTGRAKLRRSTRLTALVAVMLGAVALVMDLGRPERFINMMRTIKLTSPMSLGSWILSSFSAGIGVAAASEVDRMTGERLPLGPLRPVLRAVEGPRVWRRHFSGHRLPSTPLCCLPTPRPRRGTPPMRACRSSLSARRAWPPRVWQWSPPRSPRPARPGSWPSWASWVTWQRRRSWNAGWTRLPSSRCIRAIPA